MHARIFSVHIFKTIAFLYVLYIPDIKVKIREAEVDCDDTTGCTTCYCDLTYINILGVFAQNLRFLLPNY